MSGSKYSSEPVSESPQITTPQAVVSLGSTQLTTPSREQAEAEVRLELERSRSYIKSICQAILMNADDADEAASEVIVRALQAIPQFNYESKISTWIFRIARNTSLNILRARRGRQMLTLEDEAFIEPPSSDPDPSSQVEARVFAGQVRKAIERKADGVWDHHDYDIFEVSYRDEKLSWKEIGEIVGLGENNTKWHYHSHVKPTLLEVGKEFDFEG